jgi:hypothetical protein
VSSYAGEDQPAIGQLVRVASSATLQGVAIEVAETDEFKHGFAEAIATQYGINAKNVEVGAVTPLRRKLSSGLQIKFTMDVQDRAAIEAVEVDAGALVAATLDAFTGDAGLLAAMSVSDLAPPVDAPPADADPDAEYYYNSLVEGPGFDIISPGTGYAVGQQFAIGEAGVDGWTTPAVLSVAAVDDSGSLLSADLIDGGKFSGGSTKIGTYPAIVQVLVATLAIVLATLLFFCGPLHPRARSLMPPTRSCPRHLCLDCHPYVF